MRSFRRHAPLIDAMTVDQPPQQPDRAIDAAQANALADEAEAIAAAAEATAAAARAKARALRLRRQAAALETAPPTSHPGTAKDSAPADAEATANTDPTDLTEKEPGTTPDTVVGEPAAAEQGDGADAVENTPTRSTHRPSVRRALKIAVASLATLCTLTLLAASGYMAWQHHLDAKHQQQTAEYEASAKRAVVTLMSLDFTKAKEDVQRIIDNSTGRFRDDFKNQADDFVKVAQDSKVLTAVDVTAAVVESMTDDSAIVLVSATSHVTNSSGAKQEPRSWRLSVNLQRDGGQIKMSKVEFVP